MRTFFLISCTKVRNGVAQDIRELVDVQLLPIVINSTYFIQTWPKRVCHQVAYCLQNANNVLKNKLDALMCLAGIKQPDLLKNICRSRLLWIGRNIENTIKYRYIPALLLMYGSVVKIIKQ